jgi:hypothetical protein
MKLREMAKLLHAAKRATTAMDRDLALTGLMFVLVKAYAAKYGTDEQDTMQDLLRMLWESDPC